jgi:hypothetical protein
MALSLRYGCNLTRMLWSDYGLLFIRNNILRKHAMRVFFGQTIPFPTIHPLKYDAASQLQLNLAVSAVPAIESVVTPMSAQLNTNTALIPYTPTCGHEPTNTPCNRPHTAGGQEIILGELRNDIWRRLVARQVPLRMFLARLPPTRPTDVDYGVRYQRKAFPEIPAIAQTCYKIREHFQICLRGHRH